MARRENNIELARVYLGRARRVRLHGALSRGEKLAEAVLLLALIRSYRLAAAAAGRSAE